MQPLRRFTAITVVLLAWLLLLIPAEAQNPVPERPGGPGLTPQNVIIIVADDVGVDVLEVYGEAGACSVSGTQCVKKQDCPHGETCETDYPVTPNIDSLRASGVLFRNAYSDPLCTPSRATIQTGRYGFRTGVTRVGMSVPTDELFVPEVLSDLNPNLGYTHAAFGKWHMGLGDSAPNAQGYDHFSGTAHNLQDFFTWSKLINGQGASGCEPFDGQSVFKCTTYATTENVDDAIDWIGLQTQPWFIWFAFNAPHAPWQVPPYGLVDPATLARMPRDAANPALPAPPGTTCPPGDEQRACYLGMIEALDVEMGRLVGFIDSLPQRTTVIFVGDNGTPGQVTRKPFFPNHAKFTVFEGGINVPLIVRTAARVNGGAESLALVNTVDLFGLALDLAGAVQPTDRTLDAVALLPLVMDPTLQSRSFAMGELTLRKGIRDKAWKLVYQGFDQFFHLPTDPFEQTDLLASGEPIPEQAALDALRDVRSSLFCDDNVTCTSDVWADNVCTQTDNCPAGQKCDLGFNTCGRECFADADCNDSNSCTHDLCLTSVQQVPATEPGVCRHYPISGCSGGGGPRPKPVFMEQIIEEQ